MLYVTHKKYIFENGAISSNFNMCRDKKFLMIKKSFFATVGNKVAALSKKHKDCFLRRDKLFNSFHYKYITNDNCLVIIIFIFSICVQNIM